MNKLDKKIAKAIKILYPDYKFIAKDEDGEVWIFKEKPDLLVDMWDCPSAFGHRLASKVVIKEFEGVDWEESLMELS